MGGWVRRFCTRVSAFVPVGGDPVFFFITMFCLYPLYRLALTRSGTNRRICLLLYVVLYYCIT